MVRIAADGGNHITFRMCNRVKHENPGGHHAEVGYAIQPLIAIVCRRGLAVAGYRHRIIAGGRRGEVKCVTRRIGIRRFDNGIAQLDGHMVRNVRTERIPTDPRRCHGNHRGTVRILVAGIQGHVLRERLPLILCGQFVRLLIVTHPPADECRTVFGGGCRQIVQYAVHSLGGRVTCVAAHKSRRVFGLTGQLLKARIDRGILLDGDTVEHESTRVVLIGVPANEGITVLFRILRFGCVLAVQHLLRRDRTAAVHIIGNGELTALKHSVGASVVCKRQDAVFDLGGGSGTVSLLERKRQNAVLIGESTALVAVQTGEHERIPRNGEQVFVVPLRHEVDIIDPIVFLRLIVGLRGGSIAPAFVARRQ